MRMHLTVVLILLCLGNLSWWDSALSWMYSIFCWEFFMSALNLVMISDISDTCMLYLVDRHRGLSTYKWTNTLQLLLSKLVQWLLGVRQWSHFAYRTLSICDEKDSLSLSRIWETSSKLVTHIWRLVHFEVIPNKKFGPHVSVSSKRMDL